MPALVYYYDLTPEGNPAMALEKLVNDQLTQLGAPWQVVAAYPVPRPAPVPYAHIVCVIYQK